MKMKRATLLLVIFIFLLNFILIGGYFKYFLIPQLSTVIEANNEQLNINLNDILNDIENSASLYTTIDDFANNNNIDVPYKIAPRRSGDIAECYADPTRARELLNWEAELDLDCMVKSAYNFVSKNK